MKGPDLLEDESLGQLVARVNGIGGTLAAERTFVRTHISFNPCALHSRADVAFRLQLRNANSTQKLRRGHSTLLENFMSAICFQATKPPGQSFKFYCKPIPCAGNFKSPKS